MHTYGAMTQKNSSRAVDKMVTFTPAVAPPATLLPSLCCHGGGDTGPRQCAIRKLARVCVFAFSWLLACSGSSGQGGDEGGSR